MSKAFTKESDTGAHGAADEMDGNNALRTLPAGTKNYITPAGADRLRAELRQLLHVTRPEIVRTVQWAASNGDRSENADYIYGKRRLREIDRRIRFLTKRLEAAEVVDPSRQRGDRVLFGATVVMAGQDGRHRTVQIVGIDETDPASGRISWISPLARALLGAAQGDVVTIRAPRGDEELEVLEIRYV